MTTVAVPEPVVLNLPAGVSSSRARCRSSHASSASSTVTSPSAGSHAPRGTNGGGRCRLETGRALRVSSAAFAGAHGRDCCRAAMRHRMATAQGSFGPIFGMATGRGGR